jgi:F-type H+-transporting ATPase subunit delta
MFHPGNWAAAFNNSLEKEGEDLEDGIEIFTVLASLVKNLHIVGYSGAEKLEKLIRETMGKSGAITRAGETAIRFLILIVRKNKSHHLALICKELNKLLEKKRAIISVAAECTVLPDENFKSRLKDFLKQRMKVTGVEITWKVNPDLLGGYRLRIGDEVIDASVRAQLGKLETCLAGDGGF